jgi:hypothetical protein
VQTIPASEITLRELKQAFGLQQAPLTFFPEWVETHAALSEVEQHLLGMITNENEFLFLKSTG